MRLKAKTNIIGVGIVTFILLLGSTVFCIAQSEQVNEASYQDLKEELDFTKTKTILVPRHDLQLDEQKKVSPSFLTGLGLGALGNFLVYLLIVGLIGLILYLVYSNIKFEEKIDPDGLVVQDFEDIEDFDPDIGLKDALEAGDFRLAIRMKFIKVLQSLVKKGTIQWTPEKTNRDYRRELTHPNEKEKFGELALIYENIWFGNFPISGDEYAEYSPLFDHLTNES